MPTIHHDFIDSFTLAVVPCLMLDSLVDVSSLDLHHHFLAKPPIFYRSLPRFC